MFDLRNLSVRPILNHQVAALAVRFQYSCAPGEGVYVDLPLSVEELQNASMFASVVENALRTLAYILYEPEQCMTDPDLGPLSQQQVDQIKAAMRGPRA